MYYLKKPVSLPKGTMIGWMEYYVDSPSKGDRPDAAAAGARR